MLLGLSPNPLCILLRTAVVTSFQKAVPSFPQVQPDSTGFRPMVAFHFMPGFLLFLVLVLKQLHGKSVRTHASLGTARESMSGRLLLANGRGDRS